MNLFGTPACRACGGDLKPVTAQHSYTGALPGVIFECEACGKIWQQSADTNQIESPDEAPGPDFDAGLAYRCNQPGRDGFYRSADPTIYSADK